MLTPVTIVVFAASALTALVALFYLWRNRILDDWLLGAAAILELGLLVQSVVALFRVGRVSGGGAEQATFAAYAFTLPVIPPAVVVLALKEKTRWAMGVIVGGVFAVVVMTARLAQIWGTHA